MACVLRLDSDFSIMLIRSLRFNWGHRAAHAQSGTRVGSEALYYKNLTGEVWRYKP